MRLSILKFLTASGAAILFLLAPSTAEAQRATSSRWQTIDADGLFTFRLPRGFAKTDMMGIENYLCEYYEGQTRFLFVWHDTASSEYDERLIGGLRETETIIDGKRATIRTFHITRNRIRVYVAELNVGSWRDGKVRLYMGLESRRRAQIATARQVFNSVRFSNRGRN